MTTPRHGQRQIFDEKECDLMTPVVEPEEYTQRNQGKKRQLLQELQQHFRRRLTVIP